MIDPAGPALDALLSWGDVVRRDLPWRRTRDPFAILVAEVMLQQTQVDRVIPRWLRFLERWATPASLAAAGLSDVLVEWSGLGYPRRARNLHLAAGEVVERFAGSLPRDLDALLSLPGVGAYTARAVQVFAFEVDTGVVDTNIARVLARVTGRRLTAREAQALADAAVPPGRSWEHNQTLMDLGATVCRRRPTCEACPIAEWCSWRRDAGESADPAIGSAGASGRQARFEGSDRQLRGRLMAALAVGDVALDDVGRVVALPDDPQRCARVVASLVRDGLVAVVDDGAGGAGGAVRAGSAAMVRLGGAPPAPRPG